MYNSRLDYRKKVQYSRKAAEGLQSRLEDKPLKFQVPFWGQTSNILTSLSPKRDTAVVEEGYNPFKTAGSFWGQLGANCLKFEWCLPKTGLQFLKG